VTGSEDRKWVEMVQDHVQWRSLLLAFLNLQLFLSQAYIPTGTTEHGRPLTDTWHLIGWTKLINFLIV